MDYIAQPKDYWIAQGAINITLNALGDPNRIQGSVASGAVILCYIEGVDGLGYDNGHRFRTWPLTISPTYFNSNTEKYVYVAIPRSAAVGTQAVVVFPSEQLDIYGVNANDEQVGSGDYYYVWLQGIISSSGPYGTTNRTWTAEMDFGKKGTDEDLYDDTEGEWYQYSKVSGLVTFLKNLAMKAGTTFHNLYLGYNELKGVATAATSPDFIDSETLVATPSYIHANYISKKTEDTAEEQIGFLKGLWVKAKGLFGFDKDGNVTAENGLFSGMITAMRAVISTISSPNYQGGELAGKGWQITNNDDSGASRMEVDNLVVRMKMLVNILEARKYVALGGNYVYSPASSVIEQVDYYDSNGNLLGYETTKVPFLLRLVPMLANMKIFSRSRIVSKKENVNMSDVAYFRCWIKADDGTTRTINTWQPGMLARCQTLDIEMGGGGTHSETYYDGKSYEVTAHGNKLYWRETIATGQAHFPVNDDGTVHSYVDLSNATGHFLAGSDVPGIGDSIVCYGGTKVDYANIIVIETVGPDAPAIKEMMGVGLQTIGQDNSGGQMPVFAVTADNLRTRISPKTGNRFIAPEFYIEATVGGTRTNLATFVVNTEGMLSYVKGVIDNGKNLLTGVLTGKGWYDDNDDPLLVDGDDGMWSDNSQFYYSPYVGTQEETIFSFYYEDNPSNPNVSVSAEDIEGRLLPVTGFAPTGEYMDVGGVSIPRWKVYIPANNSFRILIEDDRSGINIYHPQLEIKGNKTMPTDFDVCSAETSSRIKQTANEIDLSVRNDLSSTGININGNNKTIKLIANKVNFYDSNGTNLNPKIWIDPENGTLHAVDGVFDGSLLFHKLIVSGETTTSLTLYTPHYVEGVLDHLTLDGDIILIRGPKRGASSVTQGITSNFAIHLPPASLFPGAHIRIVNGTYTNNSGVLERDLSRIEVYVDHDPLTEPEAPLEEHGVKVNVINNIAVAFPLNYYYGGIYQNVYGFFENITYDSYGTIELISTKNYYYTADEYYVWMVIDART